MGTSLENQRIVVTGAAGGVGRATVATLLADGARVCATDLAIDPGMFAPTTPDRLTTVAGDVTKSADVDGIYEHAERILAGSTAWSAMPATSSPSLRTRPARRSGTASWTRTQSPCS